MTEDKKVQAQPVKVVASKELAEQIEQELLIEDPDAEKAKAILAGEANASK